MLLYVIRHWSQTDYLTQEAVGQSGIVQIKSSESKHEIRNIQRDQSASRQQNPALQEIHGLLTTATDLPTDAPFISFPATKSPGW